MSKSIISNEKECVVCKTTRNLHKHHIFYGTGLRSMSEHFGCWCYLCATHHNMSDHGVHFNKELDNNLKILCQQKWEEKYGNREEFIQTFGRSYI